MFTYSSKLSIPKTFSVSTIWEILWIWPLSVNFKFTELLENQVEWILQAVFNWWFSWDILSLIKGLPENHNCYRSEDLSFKCFWFKRTFCLCLRHLNLTMTRFVFFRRWLECSCSGTTLTPVRDKVLPPKFYPPFPQTFWNRVYFKCFSSVILRIFQRILFQLNYSL